MFGKKKEVLPSESGPVGPTPVEQTLTALLEVARVNTALLGITLQLVREIKEIKTELGKDRVLVVNSLIPDEKPSQLIPVDLTPKDPVLGVGVFMCPNPECGFVTQREAWNAPAGTTVIRFTCENCDHPIKVTNDNGQEIVKDLG